MSLRVIWMGMLGAFSAIPLEWLSAARVDVCAVIVPAPATAPAHPFRRVEPPPSHVARQQLPMLAEPAQPNIIALAWARHIPVFEVNTLRDPQFAALLTHFRPDAILVACFPFILPKRWLTLPTHGCFNLHPSLLPQLRGPAPLFWTFHAGARPGVTLHAMSARADAGDIVAQTPLTFPDGITYADAERVCAEAGAALMVDLLRAMERGTLTTRLQDEREASYFPSPSPADFIVTPGWSARRAFNFMRGMSGYGQPILQSGDERFVVREVIGYTTGETIGEAYRGAGDEIPVQFADGVVRVNIRAEPIESPE